MCVRGVEYRGGYHDHVEDLLSTARSVQYRGGYLEYRGGVQYLGGYHEYHGGYLEYRGDTRYHGGIMMHVGDITSTVAGKISCYLSKSGNLICQIDRAVNSHVLKTIDNVLNRGLLSIRHLEIF